MSSGGVNHTAALTPAHCTAETRRSEGAAVDLYISTMRDPCGGDLPGGREGGVAWLVLNRKDKEVNVVDDVLSDELRAAAEAVAKAAEAGEVKVACVLSVKEEGFCHGLNLDVLYGVTDKQEAVALFRKAFTAFDSVSLLPVPSVAVVHGCALGAGFELALACTVRVSAKDAIVGFPEVKLGMLPACGGLLRLPQLVGLGGAADVIVNSRVMQAAVAQEARLLDFLVESRTGRAGAAEVDRILWDVVTRAPTLVLQRGLSTQEEWLQSTLPGRMFLKHRNTVQNAASLAPEMAFDTLSRTQRMGTGAEAVPYSVFAAATAAVSSRSKTLVKQWRDNRDMQKLTRSGLQHQSVRRSLLVIGGPRDVAAALSAGLKRGRYCMLAAPSSAQRCAVIEAMDDVLHGAEFDQMIPRLQKTDSFCEVTPSSSGYGIIAVVWDAATSGLPAAEHDAHMREHFLRFLDSPPNGPAEEPWVWLRALDAAPSPAKAATPCVRCDLHLTPQSTTADLQTPPVGGDDAAYAAALSKLVGLGCRVLPCRRAGLLAHGVVDSLVAAAHACAVEAGAPAAAVDEHLGLGTGTLSRSLFSCSSSALRLGLSEDGLPQSTLDGAGAAERFLRLLVERLAAVVDGRGDDEWLTRSVVDTLFVSSLDWPQAVGGPFSLFDTRGYFLKDIGSEYPATVKAIEADGRLLKEHPLVDAKADELCQTYVNTTPKTIGLRDLFLCAAAYAAYWVLIRFCTNLWALVAGGNTI